MNRIGYIFIICSTLIWVSCTKKDNRYSEDPAYTGATQVNFDNYVDADGNFGYTKVELPIKDTVVEVEVKVKLTNTTSVAANDISIYLAKVDALVTDWDPTLTPVSATSTAVQYDLSKPVVIKKGQRKGSFIIKVNPSKLNLSLLNAIGLGIVKGEGVELSGNPKQNGVVVELGTRNSWDGLYTVVSRVVDSNRLASISTAFFGSSPQLYVALVSTGSNSNDMSWPNFAPPNLLHIAPALPTGWTSYGNAIPRYVWNPATDRVTGIENSSPVLAPQNRSFTVNAAYNATSNRRFPDGTVVVRYFMNQTGFKPVEIFDSLTYVGPR